MVALAPLAPGLSRLRAIATTAGRAVKSAASAAVTPHKASVRRLADIPLTVVGGGCIDFAAFHYIHMVGWLITGLSLVALEHLIADDV